MGLQSPHHHHHSSAAAFCVLVLGTVWAETGKGSVLLGLSEHRVMLSPALHTTGVHRETELSAAGLAFVLFYFIFSLNFVAWSHPGVGLQEKVSLSDSLTIALATQHMKVKHCCLVLQDTEK